MGQKIRRKRNRLPQARGFLCGVQSLLPSRAGQKISGPGPDLSGHRFRKGRLFAKQRKGENGRRSSGMRPEPFRHGQFPPRTASLRLQFLARSCRQQDSRAFVLFLYGAITPRTVRLTCVAYGREDVIVRLGSSSLPSLDNLRKRIESLFRERFGDENDRNDLICILRQEMSDPRSREFSGYTEDARKIMEKYGGDFR